MSEHTELPKFYADDDEIFQRRDGDSACFPVLRMHGGCSAKQLALLMNRGEHYSELVDILKDFLAYDYPYVSTPSPILKKIIAKATALLAKLEPAEEPTS